MKLGNNRGFTVIEMLAVTAMIVIISGSLIANYRGSNKDAELKNAAQELVSVLRRAQGAALSGLQYNGALPSNYRVHVSETAGTPIMLCAASDRCTSNVIETIQLPSNVYVYRINAQNSSPIEFDYADIMFTAPYADIEFIGSTMNPDKSRPLRIELRNAQGKSRIIEVNPISGKFEITSS